MRVRLIITSLALLSAAPATSFAQRRATQAARPEPRPTEAQLRAAGQILVQRAQAKFGESKDTAKINLVRGIIEPLRRTAGYTRADFEWHVVNDTSFNAQAAPGGFVIVNVGLLTSLSKFAVADRPNDPAAQRKRLEAFTAAVLGHELSHLILGHTDSLDSFLAPGAKKVADESREAQIERVLRDPTMLRSARHSRDQELAADANGAVLILRAGWDVQSAMDLFRHMGEQERRERGSIQAISWLLDHPAAPEREGRLDQLRGTLKIDQAHFDDAYSAVMNGVLLDEAVASIDTVLQHFPDNTEALHLRAAAFHRAFLREVPTKQQEVMSFVPAYEAKILEGIRGGEYTAAAQTALDSARAAYRRTLSHKLMSYSLSNLAVLDAYAQDNAAAIARADSAVKLDTADLTVRVNRGVVKYITRNYAAALAEFQAVQRMLGAGNPTLTFNIGRAQLALGDTAAGRAAMAAYARADAKGPWHDYAVSLSGSAKSTTSAGSPAPSGAGLAVAGAPAVAIGASASDVRRALGAPEQTTTRGNSAIWYYRTKGIAIALTRNLVVVVNLVTPAAGAIDGVHVGDPTQRAAATWGAVVSRGEHTLYFRRGNLVVAVDDDSGTISSLSIQQN